MRRTHVWSLVGICCIVKWKKRKGISFLAKSKTRATKTWEMTFSSRNLNYWEDLVELGSLKVRDRQEFLVINVRRIPGRPEVRDSPTWWPLMNLPLLLLWVILFPHYPSHAMHSLCHCSLNTPHIPIVHLLFPLLECASINFRISNFLISCRSCSNVSLMLALKGKWQPPPHPLSSLIIYFTWQHLAPYGIICIYMDTHTLYIFYIYFLFSFYSLSLAWKLPKDESSLFFTLEPLVLYSRNINKSNKPDTHCKGAEEVISSVCPTCDPIGYSLPGFSVHGNSPGKNARVGSHSLLQGIFLTQTSDLCLPHCRQIL